MCGLVGFLALSAESAPTLEWMTSLIETLSVAQALERHVRGETDESNLLFNVAQRDAWFDLHAARWEPVVQSLTRSSA